MSSNKEKTLAKVLGIYKESVKMLFLVDINDKGEALVQIRESSLSLNGFLSIERIVRNSCDVGDYCYVITDMAPGKMDLSIEKLTEVKSYEKKIIDDYLNDELKDSYLDDIREYKIVKLIDDEK